MKGIDHVPYDIWHLIFQLVCTDGGASGCALARTSKSFRALSASTRFHSLALHSLTDIRNFLVCFERIRRSNPSSSLDGPAIHNLLLSFLPDTCDAPRRTFRKWTDYALSERALIFQLANDHRTWAASKTRWNREFVLHVSRLLQVAAPTLRTLTVLQCGEIRLPLVHYRPFGFPALRELTLLGDDRMFVRVPGPGVLVPGQNDPSDFELYSVPTTTTTTTDAPSGEDDSDDRGSEVPFPALTHLHVVVSGPKLHPWDKTLPRWAALAPAVTHLRVSQGNEQLPSVLGEMLGVPPPPTVPPEPDDVDMVTEAVEAEEETLLQDTKPTYPSLRVVIVQMCGARKTNNALSPHSRELERIADGCAVRELLQPRPRLVILHSRAYIPGYWETRLSWEWRRQMVGGGGCWSEDEDDENVWKTFVPELARRPAGSKKGALTVGISEVRNADVQHGVTGKNQRKKWWKVLANGIPRIKKSIA